MRVWITVIACVFFIYPAHAGSFFEDVGRTIGRATIDVGKAQQKAAQDTSKALEKAVQDTQNVAVKPIFPADPKSLLRDLAGKSDVDLQSLALSPDPCIDIDCHGVRSDLARQAVGETRTQRQTLVDLEVRKSQAWAAVASAGISSLSLIISIAGFVRAGRKTPAPPSSAPAGTLNARPQIS